MADGRQQTGFTGNVLAVNVPVVSYERKPEEVSRFYKEAIRRISELPGVERVALGTVVPWRDPGFFAAQFTVEGTDMDDENLVPEPAMTVYHPMSQEMNGGRLFIHAKLDPYTLVPSVTKVIRELASDQPSGPRRSTTSARRCWPPIASTRSCSGDSPEWRS